MRGGLELPGQKVSSTRESKDPYVLSLILDAKSIRKFIIISTRSGKAFTLTPPFTIYPTTSAPGTHREWFVGLTSMA